MGGQSPAHLVSSSCYTVDTRSLVCLFLVHPYPTYLPKTPDLINSHLNSLVLFSAFSSSFWFALVYLYALTDAHGAHVLGTIQLILVALGRLIHPFHLYMRQKPEVPNSSVALKPPPSIRLWLYKRLVSRTESSCPTDFRPSHTK